MTTGLSRSSDPSTSHEADQMAKTFDSRCYLRQLPSSRYTSTRRGRNSQRVTD